MDDLLGVDLGDAFSAEANRTGERRSGRRRNPDRQARRWDRPCGHCLASHTHFLPSTCMIGLQYLKVSLH